MIPSVPLVQAVDLACRRGDRMLFSGLSFAVPDGGIVWLRGANGSGKTSLLRLLAGLSRPAAGTIRWGPDGAASDRATLARRRLYVAHANALKDDLTPDESLAFLTRLHGDEAAPAQRAEALRCFGLHARRHAPVRTLSQGQRRRVALARLALARPTTLWLLDEPFDALDAEGVGTLDAVLRRHAAEGGAVVLTSHLPLSAGAPAMVELHLAESRPA